MPIQPLSRVAHRDLDLMPSEPMKARPEVAVRCDYALIIATRSAMNY
jgi:hypothetical protein